MLRRVCGEQSIAIRNGRVELRSPKTLLLQAHQSALKPPWVAASRVAGIAASMNMKPAANADANRRAVVVARRRNDAAAQAANQG